MSLDLRINYILSVLNFKLKSFNSVMNETVFNLKYCIMKTYDILK